MLIKLKDIGEKSSSFNFSLPRNSFLRLDEKFIFEEMNCEAKLRTKQDIVVIKGSYRLVLEGNCDLCLAPATFNMAGHFDLNLIPNTNKIFHKKDLEISLSSPDVDFYTRQEVSLDRYYEDQLLMDLPLSLKCSEECLGFCCGCGVNLNDGTCQCKTISSNPFYVLSQLQH